jgi:hypothetical protein
MPFFAKGDSLKPILAYIRVFPVFLGFSLGSVPINWSEALGLINPA